MSSKKIKIYTSFEEQQKDILAYSLSISPAQRIKEAVALIREVYKEELAKPKNNKRIKITFLP
jgi:hypothetical protein